MTTLTSPTRPAIVDDVTRRQFITMLTAAGLLAACGRNTAPQDPAAGNTRRISHALGETDVPASPQR